MDWIFAADVKSSVSRKECEQLAYLAYRKDILEMGSYLGRSTIALASSAKLVISVDRHTGDAHVGRQNTYKDFMANLVRYDVKKKVQVMVGEFQEIVPRISFKFDLVFVDGQHDKKSIERDGRLAYDALKHGGILAFHDYGSIFYPIQEYVDALVAEKGAILRLVEKLAVVEGAKK